MSDAELARLRRDLDIIQSAAGLELPFGWWEVWLILATIPAGAIIVAWAAAGPYEYLSMSLLPLVLLFLTYAGTWGLRFRHHLRERREHKFEVVLAAAFLGALACLIAWDRTLGLPPEIVRGAGFILAGIMFIPLAFSSPVRRAYLACPCMLIPAGVAFPLCTRQEMYLVFGSTLMAGSLIAAGIMAWQLRRSGRGHEPNTN